MTTDATIIITFGICILMGAIAAWEIEKENKVGAIMILMIILFFVWSQMTTTGY